MPLFPSKLHDLLSFAHENGHDSIISWLPHGRSFKIHDPNRFEQTLMTTRFKQSSFMSFVRQLNFWGFKKIKKAGDDEGSYWHPSFLRDEPDMCYMMVRNHKKNKGNNTAEQRNVAESSVHVTTTPSSSSSPESDEDQKDTSSATVSEAGSAFALQRQLPATSQDEAIRDQAVPTEFLPPSSLQVNLLLRPLQDQVVNQPLLAMILSSMNGGNANQLHQTLTPTPGTSSNQQLSDLLEVVGLVELSVRLNEIIVKNSRGHNPR